MLVKTAIEKANRNDKKETTSKIPFSVAVSMTTDESLAPIQHLLSIFAAVEWFHLNEFWGKKSLRWVSTINLDDREVTRKGTNEWMDERMYGSQEPATTFAMNLGSKGTQCRQADLYFNYAFIINSFLSKYIPLESRRVWLHGRASWHGIIYRY